MGPVSEPTCSSGALSALNCSIAVFRLATAASCGSSCDTSSRDPRKEATAAQRALVLTEKPPETMTALDQMGLVYTVMRMFDPNSVVRESEYAIAQAAQGLPARLKNYLTQLDTGKKLNPEQVLQMRDIAQRYAQLASESVAAQDQIFAERAKAWGVDPGNIGRISTGVRPQPGAAAPGAAPGAPGRPPPGAVVPLD